MTARLAVLLSGHGSNLQALLDACADGRLPAEIVLVISDQPDAYGLERAARAGIQAVPFPAGAYRDRAAYDTALAGLVASYCPDWICLAGWMRLLSMAFLGQFPGRVINLHPALPGTFPGAHAIAEAFAAFRAGRIRETGVMIHHVPDEGVDDGPVILSRPVPIRAGDTPETLEARIHAVEHRAYVDALRMVVGASDQSLGQTNRRCIMEQPKMFELLAASGPFAGDADKLMLYGRLVGSWDVEAQYFDPAGGSRTVHGEWHFGWVLGGRGVQDVLAAAGAPADRRGTTLRCYDAAQDVWHITWMQPYGDEFMHLIGRQDGDRIVQEGAGKDQSRRLRWSFADITPDTFRWLGEVSLDGGATWFLEEEMHCRRRA